MKRQKFMFVLLLAMLLSILVPSRSVLAQESTIDLSAIDELAQRRVDNGTTPGVTVLVKKGNHILYHKSFGYSYLYDMGTQLENPILATNETVYDLASVTKVLATTQAIMKLVDEGKLDIDEPVATYMPEFGINGKEVITSRDLLTHTSGLAQWKPTYLYVNTREGEKEFVNNLSIVGTRGSYAYSDFSFMTLAFLVEKITGQPFESYLEANFYGPLGMADTGFNPVQRGIDINRIAATSWGNPYEWRMSNQRDYNVGYDTSADQEAFDAFTGWREYTLVGEVNDGNAGMANEGVAGHAGLYSTALDISKIGDMMLNGGSLNGSYYYSPETLTTFTTADPNRAGRGLGWRVGPSSATSGFIGNLASTQTFAHDGFTGTQVIFDPYYDIQVIVLSNKQNYGPYNDNGSYYSTYTMSREISMHAYQQIIDNINSVDKSQLKAMIQEIESTDLSNFTPESVEVLQNQLIISKDVLEKPNLIQVEINDEITTLQAVFDALIEIPQVDKALLLETLNIAENIDVALYTSETINTLKEAIISARSIFDSEEATQVEVDEAVISLQTAIDSLELIPEVVEPTVDKTLLTTLIEKVKTLDLTLYTNESVQALNEEVANANLVESNSEATQEEVDLAVTKLQNSIDSLELIPEVIEPEIDKSKLESLIKELESLDTNHYTQESIQNLNKSLEEAKAVLSQQNVTQEVINQQIVNLQSAKDKLIVEDKPKPIEAYELIDEETNIKASIPTDAFDSKVTMVVNPVSRAIPNRNTLAYDIYFLDELTQERVTPKVNVTVSIPTKNLDNKGLKLYHEISENNHEEFTYTLKDNKVIFTSSDFSVYILSAVKPVQKPTLPNTGQESFLLYSILGVAVIGYGLYFVFKKQKQQ